MARDVLLGLDVGTSAVKAILVDPDGEVIATTATPLALATPRVGWAEQDPESWWHATLNSVAALRPHIVARRVLAVGISGQMHSSVFLDAAGNVVRPALLWCDGRTTVQCREIAERAGGEERLRDWVSNPALEGFTLPKILWLRTHEPDAFARVAKVLLAKDYIRFCLTNDLATEPSDASGTLMYDPARLRWSREIMAAVGLPLDMLPNVGGSGEVLGRLHKEAAAATGLAQGTPIVGGGADNACGAAGVGCIAPSDAVASWGTSGTVLAPTAKPRVDPQLRAHTFCHVATNVWYVMGVTLTAGAAFSWYRDQFSRELTDSDLANERLGDEAAGVARGADGATFLPYLQGERTPHRDASVRGAFLGLSLAHSRAHLTRAVVEGICFALRDSLSILRELDLAPASLLLTGGGARSRFVRQVLAEVCGLPIGTVNREEGPAYGAALLAGVGAGVFRDLAEACRATLSRRPPDTPDAGAHREYETAYARFRAAYPAARVWASGFPAP